MKTIAAIRKEALKIKSSSQSQHLKIKEVFKDLIDLIQAFDERLVKLETAKPEELLIPELTSKPKLAEPKSKLSPELAKALKKGDKKDG